MSPHAHGRGQYPWLTLLAGMILTGVLGSIHAFSVFIFALENQLGAARAQVSSIYSLALLCLTIAVLFGHRIYARLSAPKLSAVACLVAASGLCVAGLSQSLAGFWIGYGVLFGAANGLGYGYSLQLAAQAMPERKGFAMGGVTAVYAVGASVFAKVFSVLLATRTPGRVMLIMAGILVAVAILLWILLSIAGALYRGETATRSVSKSDTKRALQLRLWGGYGLGAAAGLMAMGHAAGIVAASGGSTAQRVFGIMLITIGNAGGGFCAGWLVDRWPLQRLLVGLPALSFLVLLGLAATASANTAIAALCLIGFCYGAIIAVYPAAVAHYFGTAASARIYGRIFTAWGIAGLAAPWLAGYLYDASGYYTQALLMAALAGLCSALVVLSLPETQMSSNSLSKT